MIENIEKLLERDERINLIAMKSNNLSQHSRNINFISAKIKREERNKQMKMLAIYGGAAAVIFYNI